jgi:two-component system NarL family sensor kinase
VESALRTLEEDPARARQRLERALATTRESLDEARRSVEDLRAAPLAGRPLAEALAALARTFTSDTGIRVHVRTIGARALNAPASSDHPAVVPLRCEAELYRIAQEALANVRQHARAQEVEITLRVTPRAVRLTIHDDGRGLPAAASGAAGTSQKDHLGPAAGRGHGIPGMQERARLLSGSLQIASRAGRGTTVTATIPRSAEGTPGGSG